MGEMAEITGYREGYTSQGVAQKNGVGKGDHAGACELCHQSQAWRWQELLRDSAWRISPRGRRVGAGWEQGRDKGETDMWRREMCREWLTTAGRAKGTQETGDWSSIICYPPKGRCAWQDGSSDAGRR